VCSRLARRSLVAITTIVLNPSTATPSSRSETSTTLSQLEATFSAIASSSARLPRATWSVAAAVVDHDEALPTGAVQPWQQRPERRPTDGRDHDVEADCGRGGATRSQLLSLLTSLKNVLSSPPAFSS
jgi:hypothetical protein